MQPELLAPASIDLFERDGYVVIRQACPPALRQKIEARVRCELAALRDPVEYEADVGYPGSPPTREAPGGATPRRLLEACARDPLLAAWATSPTIAAPLYRILTATRASSSAAQSAPTVAAAADAPAAATAGATAEIRLSQSHHNCVMTKHPGFSSETQWHQDIRYWSFARPELVSAWLALTPETPENGALQIVPGSHRLEFARARFDEAIFFRPELPENAALIARAEPVTLAPGDLVLFHCRALHAAGRNTTPDVKLSCVFTYHGVDNPPTPGTRSARLPSLPLPRPDADPPAL